METTESRAPRRPAAGAGLQQRLARRLLPGRVCIPWPWHVVSGSGEKLCQELAQQSLSVTTSLSPARPPAAGAGSASLLEVKERLGRARSFFQR